MKLEDIRRKLSEQRRTLLQQVARVEDNLRWLDTNVEPEIEEEGQEENIARLLARLDDREREELEAIDRALARIETGEYGRCTVMRAAHPRRTPGSAARRPTPVCLRASAGRPAVVSR